VTTATNERGEQETFPELYQDPKEFPPGEQKSIKEANEAARTLYRAVRYLLIHDFGFSQAVPADPHSFPGSLSARERTQFLTVHGIMIADNYTQPLLGKDGPNGDDLVVTDGTSQEPIYIARRFADHLVAAVQEYTARADLFSKVYGFLTEEARNPSTPSRSHSSPV